jgi:L-cystine transport system substrate-binding protein
MKVIKPFFVVFSLVVIFVALNVPALAASPSKPRVIEVAVDGSGRPITYMDADGQIKGWEVDILKEIDEILPEYTFHVQIAGDDAIAVGLKTGKYQIGGGNNWYSEARAKNFNLSNIINYTPITLLIRDDSPIKTLYDLNGKTIQPITRDNGSWYPLQNFLNENPDIKINCENAGGLGKADIYIGVNNGRWDAAYVPLPSIEAIKDEMNLPVHTIGPIDFAASHFLVSKNEPELLEKLNSAIDKLKASGWFSRHSVEVFGDDVFASYEGLKSRYGK